MCTTRSPSPVLRRGNVGGGGGGSGGGGSDGGGGGIATSCCLKIERALARYDAIIKITITIKNK